MPTTVPKDVCPLNRIMPEGIPSCYCDVDIWQTSLLGCPSCSGDKSGSESVCNQHLTIITFLSEPAMGVVAVL